MGYSSYYTASFSLESKLVRFASKILSSKANAFSKDIVALAILYPIVIFCVKLSISLLYLRLFGLQKAFRYSVYGGTMFCFLFYTAYMGTQIGSAILCDNTESTRHSLCRNGQVLTIISGVVNVVTDLYLLVLPIPPLTQLKLRRRRKLGLLLIFMAGLMQAQTPLCS